MEQIDQAWLLEQAQSISKDDVNRLLRNIEGLMEEISEVKELRELKPAVKNAVSMIQDFQEESFKEITWEKIQGISYALLYLLDPGDGIPDTTPGIGFLDDFAILVLALETIEKEMEAYRTWNREHLKDNYHL